MTRKGQAAMEFLMTYGWAILAAIVAIGVLAYFGVFNPGNLGGATATLSPPMNANAFNILNDGCGGNDCVNIEVLQNSGQSITVASATLTITSGPSAGGSCADTTALPSGWSSGSEQTLAFDCGGAGNFTSGDTLAGEITVTYTTAGSSLVQQATGSFRGSVQ